MLEIDRDAIPGRDRQTSALRGRQDPHAAPPQCRIVELRDRFHDAGVPDAGVGSRPALERNDGAAAHRDELGDVAVSGRDLRRSMTPGVLVDSRAQRLIGTSSKRSRR